MGQLDHHRATVFVHCVRQVLDPRNNLVFVRKDIVKHWRAVTADGSRPRRHRKGDTRLGALGVIGGIAFLGHAILRIGGFMTGRHNPVSQCQVFKLEGLKQGVVGHLEIPPGVARYLTWVSSEHFSN